MTDQRTVLPGCMMPDGAEPCVAFQRLQAERDLLRTALKEIRDMPYDSTTPYTVFDASSRAQEALDHD